MEHLGDNDTHTQTYTHTHTHTHTLTHTHTHTHTLTDTHIHTHILTLTHTHTYTHIHTCIRALNANNVTHMRRPRGDVTPAVGPSGLFFYVQYRSTGSTINTIQPTLTPSPLLSSPPLRTSDLCHPGCVSRRAGQRDGRHRPLGTRHGCHVSSTVHSHHLLVTVRMRSVLCECRDNRRSIGLPASVYHHRG